MLLYDIIDAFDKKKLNYAVVGGFAMALHGLIRATMDVDFVLNLKERDFKLVEQILDKIGLQSRIPVRSKEIIKMREEYIKRKNLIAWSFVDYSNPSKQVDILITEDLKDLDVVKITVAGRKVTVASLEEILRMKSKSSRPQDLVDIKNIKERLQKNG